MASTVMGGNDRLRNGKLRLRHWVPVKEEAKHCIHLDDNQCHFQDASQPGY